MINKIFYSLILGAFLFSMNPASAQSIVKDDAYYKQDIFKQINEERADIGIKALSMDAQLMKAAQMKAEDMAENGYFAHKSPAGVTPWQWFYKAGYKPSFAGENLALSRSLESRIVQSWMDSSPHKNNIVNTKFTEMGIGIAKGKYNGRDAYFIVQMLGKPSVN